MTDRADNIRKLKAEALIPKEKKRKWLRMFSKKRTQLNKSYKEIASLFLATHPMCEIGAPGCTHKSTEIHHKRGRIGKLLTDIRYFMAVCWSCHTHVENNDKWARAKGFKVSRLN